MAFYWGLNSASSFGVQAQFNPIMKPPIVDLWSSATSFFGWASRPEAPRRRFTKPCSSPLLTLPLNHLQCIERMRFQILQCTIERLTAINTMLCRNLQGPVAEMVPCTSCKKSIADKGCSVCYTPYCGKVCVLDRIVYPQPTIETA